MKSPLLALTVIMMEHYQDSRHPITTEQLNKYLEVLVNRNQDHFDFLIELKSLIEKQYPDSLEYFNLLLTYS